MFEKRKKVWDYLIRKVSKCERPLICIGDFNDITWEFEKEEGMSKERGKLECFQMMIRECNLNDIGFNGQQFTWFGIR